MTYICRPCSTKHGIPRREDRPEVGICPICQDVHGLYLVKREPAPDAGPWVLNIEQPAPAPSPWVFVEDGMPKTGCRVLITSPYMLGLDLAVGQVDYLGGWWIFNRDRRGIQRISPPKAWCPIPPLPPRC